MDLDDQIPVQHCNIGLLDPILLDHIERNLVMLVLKPDDIVIAREHPQTR